MSYDDPLTSNFEDFGYQEIDEVTDLLQALKTGNVTPVFENYWYNDEVKPMFNTHSGYVFLTNADYQVGMMNDGKLDMFENCPECGQEGFPEEFKDMMGDCESCQEIHKRFEDLEK